MSITFLLSAVLVGPSLNPSASQWREKFQLVIRDSAERAKADPQAIVPRMVEFHRSLATTNVLPNAERARMRKSIEGRLVRQLEELLQEKARHERKTRQIASRLAKASTTNSNAGGGSAFVAQPLIDMIVTTISPETWQQRGGQGSIMYYSNNPALVIRQSQRVHEEIGELLQALR